MLLNLFGIHFKRKHVSATSNFAVSTLETIAWKMDRLSGSCQKQCNFESMRVVAKVLCLDCRAATFSYVRYFYFLFFPC